MYCIRVGLRGVRIFALCAFFCVPRTPYAQAGSAASPVPAFRRSPMRVTQLRTEALTRPLGIDVERPQLSWRLVDSRRNARQTAYRILIATRPALLDDGRADIWDSGKTLSSQSANVTYAGPPLAPRQRYYWAVHVWDQSGAPTALSAPDWWETGLMHLGAWPAPWIAAYDSVGPMPLFRNAFTVQKRVARARVYATALGSYRLSLNGTRVGDAALTPDWTDYRTRVTYQTYDVTDQLRTGANVIGAWLGRGWYSGPLGWWIKDRPYGPWPERISVALYVRYTDGTETVIRSNRTWTTHAGPITSAELYNGERFDARNEPRGWDHPKFDSQEWRPARIVHAPSGLRITAQASPPIRVTRTFRPVRRWSPTRGTYLYDLGQNIAGWMRLRVSGPAGTKVQLRFAEILDSNGKNLYRDNLRKADAMDRYTLRGGGAEQYEPRFTYHGFRYVELTGYPGDPPADALIAVVANTDAPETGRFTTSDSTVNRLWENIRWSQRANFYSVPTDCPQRDERMGWMGDAQVFWRTATFNMDLQSFTRKWLTDVRDARSARGCYSYFSPQIDTATDECGPPGWGDAGVLVPWTAYQQYGDTLIVDENWDAMDRYMTLIHDDNPTFLRTKTRSFQFADWLPADGTTPTSHTAPELVATAYWMYNVQAMITMANATGRIADAARYRAVSDSIRAAFAKAYVHADGTVGKAFVNADTVANDVTQTSLIMGLHLGLVPPAQRPAAVQALVRNIVEHKDHVTTGFLGTAWLMPTLSDNGQDSVAYRLLFQETFPSWFYMIRHGATTMWERWNGDTGDKAMNSYNHYAYGVIGEWLYRYVAGIDLAHGADSSDAGFRAIRIQPRPDARLTHVHGEYDSVYGTIVSDWTLREGTFTLTATIPPNTSATVILPTGETHQVGAGTYRYTTVLHR